MQKVLLKKKKKNIRVQRNSIILFGTAKNVKQFIIKTKMSRQIPNYDYPAYYDYEDEQEEKDPDTAWDSRE